MRLIGYFTLVVAAMLAVVACGPPAAQAPAAGSAKPAAGPAAPAAESKPAAPAAAPAEPKPAVQPKPEQKPAAQPQAPQKPAAQPKAEEKPAAAAGGKLQLRLGTSDPTSSFYAYQAAVVKVINAKVPEVNVTLVSSGDYNRRLARGELDVSQNSVDSVYEAVHGLGIYKDNPIPDVRILWVWTVAPQNFLIRGDTDVKIIRDLDGKDFSAGSKGTTTETIARQALEALGVKPRYYTGALSDIMTALKDRRIVGIVKGGPTPDAAVLELLTSGRPIRLLSFSEDEQKKISAQFPHYSFTTVPDNAYRGIPAYTTLALAVPQTVMKGFSADLAYKITKAVWEGREETYAAWNAVKGNNYPEMTLQYAKTPLHAGAVRYFRELGLSVPASLLPPEMR